MRLVEDVCGKWSAGGPPRFYACMATPLRDSKPLLGGHATQVSSESIGEGFDGEPPPPPSACEERDARPDAALPFQLPGDAQGVLVPDDILVPPVVAPGNVLT